MKYDFHRWFSLMQLEKKKDKRRQKQGPKDIYTDLMVWFSKRQDMMSCMTCDAELTWYQYGQPYYKIWPKMADALGATKIDIAGRYLHLPFPVYEIAFAKGAEPRERPDTPAVKNMLVYKDTKFTDLENKQLINNPRRYKADWSLMVHYTLEGEEHKNWCGWAYRFGVDNNVSIHDRFEDSFRYSEEYKDGSYEPSKELARKLVTIAIGTAFFGLHEHELIMPDIPNKFITRYHQARQQKNESEAKKLLDKAKRLGHFGWKVGSEIDLPRPIVHHETKDTGQAGKRGELQYGHIRSGHMRLQPYGPKDNPSHYDLIFIPPTEVRPDLPIREVRGFRLRDNILQQTNK